MLELGDVTRAREVIGDRIHRTPTFTARSLGPNVLIKAELLQRTGSFKPRGVLNKLASLSDAERSRGVIGVSAGNHAQALALGASLEGLDALVVMWRSAVRSKVEATLAYGADVNLDADGPEEGFALADELVKRTGRTLIHPFDDPYIIAGHGTIGLEILEDVPHVDVVVTGVGGGGLIAGIAVAMKAIRPSVRIIGVEPEQSSALRSSLDSGRCVRVGTATVADGLAAPFAGAVCLEVAQSLVDDVVTVSEEDICSALRFSYSRTKLACEPAGAAPLAAWLTGKVAVAEGETSVLVMSGGNASSETVGEILKGQATHA